MKYALCTISFRHQLISFAEIVRFAHRHSFAGIELWGIHAQNLYECEREAVREQLRFLACNNMEISMISDYLDISSETVFAQSLEKCKRLIQLCGWFGTNRIRTFAGQKPSQAVSPGERLQYIERIKQLCRLCEAHHIYLLLEFHPNTLTDCLESSLQLLSEIDHSHLGINLDFLHVWESGADPVRSFRLLKPWVRNFHLKNIASESDLAVFQPNNVYSAAGNRSGMVPLRAGIVDYLPIMKEIGQAGGYASLEWFGPKPWQILADEMEWLGGIS
jgi:3-dehydroshikimate dehydratase